MNENNLNINLKLVNNGKSRVVYLGDLDALAN